MRYNKIETLIRGFISRQNYTSKRLQHASIMMLVRRGQRIRVTYETNDMSKKLLIESEANQKWWTQLCSLALPGCPFENMFLVSFGLAVVGLYLMSACCFCNGLLLLLPFSSLFLWTVDNCFLRRASVWLLFSTEACCIISTSYIYCRHICFTEK